MKLSEALAAALLLTNAQVYIILIYSADLIVIAADFEACYTSTVSEPVNSGGSVIMKISIIAKTAAMLVAAAMTLSFSSCGSSSSSKKDDSENGTAANDNVNENTTQPDEITGTEQTWGVFTVMVPEGWELRHGDALDENDPNVCSVKKSSFKYFDLKSEKENVQKQQYEYNKNTYTNGQTDIPPTTIGSIEWTGFQYTNDFGGGFELYAQSNGKYIRVSCAGFSFDSIETSAVLGSLKV